ncbi:MAG: hypothetical protein MZV64_48315 [Ignavibacteriales bacterium]|nr:hypothetical protein [Ignavibacteriales bacterium]
MKIVLRLNDDQHAVWRYLPKYRMHKVKLLFHSYYLHRIHDAGGIGESGTGLADNSAAIFWNPAGIAFLSGTEVSITHSNWLPQFNLDLFYDYLTLQTIY